MHTSLIGSRNVIFCWFATGAMLISGCSSGTSGRHGAQPQGEPFTTGIGQAARLGGAAQIASPAGEATVTASGFIIAKYQATEIQRKIAEQRARHAYHKMPPEKKQALQAKKIRYIAVATQKDYRFKGRQAVMIWDTQAKGLVGTDVYDVATPPPVGSSATFDTYAAEYVGAGT